MKLHIIGSSSDGNGYVLEAEGSALVIEAGVPLKAVKQALGWQITKAAGCIITHEHGDHFKYAEEYTKKMVHIYSNHAVIFEGKYSGFMWCMIPPTETVELGRFRVTPYHNFHDVEIYGYLIYHPDMGSMLFSTDSYKIGMTVRGVNHFLIEANYSDALLKENVWNGNINKAQADRIMLSHMSLDYCIKYLQDCEAEKSAKTITLCHLSERNSDPKLFHDAVAGAFSVPTYIASKNLIVEL
jgi:phosphoribosyl 1,2-cyclic phosphodiesterase